MRKNGFTVIVNKDTYNCRVITNYINKFLDDKVSYEDSSLLIVFDGVLINKGDLLKHPNDKLCDWFIKSYRAFGDGFFSSLRGSFSGVIVDKEKRQILAFSDQLGSKFVFFSQTKSDVIVSTMMSEIYNFYKEENIPYSLSAENAYLLLTYGYMVEERTLCSSIFKIKPGYYLRIDEKNIACQIQYFELNINQQEISEDEAIEIIDAAFREAVIRAFNKDVEYGYRHLVALSAGLDSRMTSWVAHELGYTDQTNFTFSQTNYYDQLIPQDIIKDLKHDWIFKPLDNGLWLYNVDDITELTGGNVLYYGLSHSYNLYKDINFDNFGIIHSGQLGDVILGSKYSDESKKLKYEIGTGAYSKRFIDRIKDLRLGDYPNQEIAWFALRGFSGTNNGLMCEYSFSETLSPFMDLDFMNICFSIPNSMRIEHNLYKKWILKKYPEAANYPWETIKAKITEPTLRLRGENIPLSQIIPRVSAKALKKVHIIKDTGNGMNPIEKYLSDNSELYDYLMSYRRYLNRIPEEKLANDVNMLLNQGKAVEKIQAISLLAALKLFY